MLGIYEDLMADENTPKLLKDKYNGDFKEMIINEVLKESINNLHNMDDFSELVDLYNEFNGNGDEEFIYKDLDEMLGDYSVDTIAYKLTTQCTFDYNKPFHKFENGGVKSLTYRDIQDIVINNNDMLEWLYEENFKEV